MKTDLDIERAETSELRELYRSWCETHGVSCKWVGKMGRPELLKKLRALFASGDIKYETDEQSTPEPEPTKPAEKPKKKPSLNDGASSIRYPLNPEVDECLHLLLEAVRLYMKRDIWVTQGRKDDPQTKKYLADAQECIQKAVGLAVGINGDGWDKAARVAYCIDRALLKMRLDFNETLASTCVLCSLLSDKHAVEMEKVTK